MVPKYFLGLESFGLMVEYLPAIMLDQEKFLQIYFYPNLAQSNVSLFSEVSSSLWQR